MSDLSVLNDKELVIIFATAPTGLGHIRVTDALYHGLPDTASPILLGAQDKSVDSLYRFVCLHPYTRALMEILQNKPWDIVFTPIVRTYLRSKTKVLFQQIITILGERLTVPKTVLIVATHTTLAHQLGEIKQTLEKQTGAKIYIIVQVTDDSPQPFWYIPEADMICVPSQYTKEQLQLYARKSGFHKVPLTVTAYPVSPLLTEKLTDAQTEDRLRQLDPDAIITNVSIPVSGAAVGTSFLSGIIKQLHHKEKRFQFHIVSKEARHTQDFILQMKRLPYISVYTSNHDRTTVNNYEKIFSDNVICLEISKPSEQAFKALCTPDQRGGVIMLFAKPVGRQEYDNLHFLRVRGMMPSKTEQEALWQYAAQKRTDILPLFKKATHHWRALLLPDDPVSASEYIIWSLKQKFLNTMMQYKPDNESIETRSDGVQQFWQVAAGLLQRKEHPSK